MKQLLQLLLTCAALSLPLSGMAIAEENLGAPAVSDTAATASTSANANAAATAEADDAMLNNANPVVALETAAAEAAEAEEGEVSMQNDPLMVVVIFAIALYLFYAWLQDYRANRAGNPNPQAFPGAVPTTAKAVIVAIVGALIILAAETGGEIALGISAEQSTMTVLMLLSITAAAFFEELIFRGYLVISNKGRALLIGSILFFSIIFAIGHPFLWDITTPEGVPGWQIWNADIQLQFDSAKGWFSTAIVLVNSLWFYAIRFSPLNPSRSLIPCIAAHLATNWGVFAVKLAQGHVSGLW